LIGRPLKAPPMAAANKTKISNLRRWALVNRFAQDLWTNLARTISPVTSDPNKVDDEDSGPSAR